MNAVERVLQAFDRRRLQSRIKDMDSQSADMRRLKNAFISNVSNQIRKPLNSLLSLTQLIRDGLAGPLTDEQRRYLEVIDRNGQTVLAQLSGILDLANLEDGALPVVVEEIIVAHLIQSTLAPLLPAAHAKGLTIEVQVPEALPRVRADGFRTGQLLRAVLDNAIKFTARGKIKVLAEASAEGPFVEVHICDTGIGIAEDRLPLLFDGFYQVDHRGDASNPGAGLGLTLVDRLARAMGGKVSVQSTVGTGSRFTVMLPAAP
jgi:signal transduction histidine kinase